MTSYWPSAARRWSLDPDSRSTCRRKRSSSGLFKRGVVKNGASLGSPIWAILFTTPSVVTSSPFLLEQTLQAHRVDRQTRADHVMDSLLGPPPSRDLQIASKASCTVAPTRGSPSCATAKRGPATARRTRCASAWPDSRPAMGNHGVHCHHGFVSNARPRVPACVCAPPHALCGDGLGMSEVPGGHLKHGPKPRRGIAQKSNGTGLTRLAMYGFVHRAVNKRPKSCRIETLPMDRQSAWRPDDRVPFRECGHMRPRFGLKKLGRRSHRASMAEFLWRKKEAKAPQVRRHVSRRSLRPNRLLLLLLPRFNSHHLKNSNDGFRLFANQFGDRQSRVAHMARTLCHRAAGRLRDVRG